MRLRFIALAVLAAAPALAAQRPFPPQAAPAAPPIPAPQSQIRAREVPVTVEGCLHGRRLALLRHTASAHEEALHASEFLLEGPKELLQLLARDHAGHHELITGIAIVPPIPEGETIDTRTKKVGPARVTGGVRQAGGGTSTQRTAPADTLRPVRIKVQSATHVAEGCVSRS